jgi:hypothetical protein
MLPAPSRAGGVVAERGFKKVPLSRKNGGVMPKKSRRVGTFLIDAHREAFRPGEPVFNKGWAGEDHHKEYARWHDWVRRVLEECCWWELNGGVENKNVNVHLQIRLTSIYTHSLDYRVPGRSIRIPKMVKQEGVEPRESSWIAWYDKRSRDADLWYKHWTSHIIEVSPSGNMTNVRTMRIRDMWQLFSKRGSSLGPRPSTPPPARERA